MWARNYIDVVNYTVGEWIVKKYNKIETFNDLVSVTAVPAFDCNGVHIIVFCDDLYDDEAYPIFDQIAKDILLELFGYGISFEYRYVQGIVEE